MGVYAVVPNPGHAANQIEEGTIANTLTITSTNRVGIKNTNPGAELEVGTGFVNGKGTVLTGSVKKNNCAIGFTRVGLSNLCISSDPLKVGNSKVYNVIQSGIVEAGLYIGARICTRADIMTACQHQIDGPGADHFKWATAATYLGSGSWSAVPADTLLLGDSAGDDNQLYVNTPSACTSGSNYNFDGLQNLVNTGNWAVRLCY